MLTNYVKLSRQFQINVLTLVIKNQFEIFLNFINIPLLVHLKIEQTLRRKCFMKI